MIRKPKWYEKLDGVKDDGSGVVGKRWFYYPAMKLYKAIRFGLRPWEEP